MQDVWDRRIADIALFSRQGHTWTMSAVQKHLFYGTLLTLAFIGSLSAIFREDLVAKVIAGACSTTLFVLAALLYCREHKRLP
ncbi:hypothetical protein [Rhizorhabdus wittichii]|nr:hypothetical protein [Rhizorhabdus wittichii]